jgi:methyl coenzyme M reductase subunit D
MDGWLARQKEYKIKERKFFKEKHPVESGICFGRMVEITKCLEDLIGVIDHLQKQSRDAYKVVLSTRLKYTSGVSCRG